MHTPGAHDTHCRRGRPSAAEDGMVRALARVKARSAHKVLGLVEMGSFAASLCDVVT